MNADMNAAKIAEYLLEAEAIKLNPNDPFTWASGWKSPMYCDNRVTLSYPHIRTFIRQCLADAVPRFFPESQAVVGVATAGIPQAAMVAETLGVPLAYIRPEPKSHGLGKQLEGFLEAGTQVVVIEDLVSTGKSSLKAIEALRKEGLEVEGLLCTVSYGFPEAEENFKKAGVLWQALCEYDDILAAYQKNHPLNAEILNSLQAWRLNPAEWGMSLK